MKTKYPEIVVQLSGEDGNAMVIMARVTASLKKFGHGDQVQAFLDEAMSGDYDNVLATCMKWVTVR